LQPKKGETKLEKLEWLELLYGYPPKVKIKWENLNDLKHDIFTYYNSDSLDDSFPFLEFNEGRLLKTLPEEAVGENYTISQYVDGYLDKINTTNFYQKKTKELQDILRKVPVFVIKNSNGEIVLTKPNSEVRVPSREQLKKRVAFLTKTNLLYKQNLQNILKKELYNFCGAFDTRVEKLSQFGLFFMNRADAEAYLNEVAISDVSGTKALGLSVHCVGLDAAYRVTREHHPGIDFRFIPDLSNLKNLLCKGSSKSYIGGSKRDQYIKGVPIYIVQVSNSPKTLLQEKFANYIFLEQKQALDFAKNQGRKVKRYSPNQEPTGTNMVLNQTFTRNSKLSISNLEDFIESWENKLQAGLANPIVLNNRNILNAESTYFVSPITTTKDILGLKNSLYPENRLQKIKTSFSVKGRVLKRSISMWLGIL
jgi:hypothetical protein